MQDRRFVRVALLAIVILGASMRLTGVNWDDHTHLHPDERFLTDMTSRLGWPKSLAEYFDTAKSPLNPYNHDNDFFVYGTLPVFITKAAGILLDKSGYDQVHLVGRVISAIYDLLTIALVYFIGRRLYGRWTGLLAAFLMACTVLDIQSSHFYTVETFITLMITVALFFAVRIVQEGRWYDWVLGGAAFGMAVAGKISVALFVVVLGLAGLMRALQEPALAVALEPAAGPRVLWRRRFAGLSLSMQTDGEARVLFALRSLIKAGLWLALAVLVAVLAFRVTQPYAFTGPSPLDFNLNPTWVRNMQTAADTLTGKIDMPPSHQWTDRAPVIYAWYNIVFWGMGLPLGLAAWAGWLVAWVEVIRKRRWDHLLLLVWVTVTFFYQSVQVVKVIRYFIPIYPMLVLLAAYFVVWLWRQSQCLAERAVQHASAWGRRLNRWSPYLAAGAGLVVVLGTLLYAEAFTNIYRRPLSRVTASRWVYANIPAGSAITWENWDDIVPVNIDGKSADQFYTLVETDPYAEDSPEKRDAILQWLDQADYVIFTSNRLYGSIPRLPERYPLTTAYYKYLFDGELGFKVIKTFTSYPNLGPIQFVDDGADEAFTVYDHPKVTILQKTPEYSSAKARALLGSIYVDRLIKQSPLETMRSHHLLLLKPLESLVQQAGGTWSAMFNIDSVANRLPVLTWVLVLEFLGLVALPYAFIAFRRFRDRGYVFAKSLGMLGVAYLSWLAASLHVLPYTRLTILGMALALLAGSAIIAWRQWDALYVFFRREWRTLLFEEALFLAFFGAFVLVRMGNPDLWHPVMGGEKPMDLAYLNAVIKSTWFPPYDPWFSGGYINYYYFGQVIVATLIKYTAIVPTTAYNLALPTLFALLATGGYGVVSGLLRKDEEAPAPVLDWGARFALLGALMIAVLGNLGEVRLLVNGFIEVSGLNFTSTIPGLDGLVKAVAGLYQVLIGGKSLPFRPEWWYWNASRVMGNGEINEFPFFSFLYGDLHAHVIALPFATLALGLIVSLMKGKRGGADRSPVGHSTWPAEDAVGGVPWLTDRVVPGGGPAPDPGAEGRLLQGKGLALGNGPAGLPALWVGAGKGWLQGDMTPEDKLALLAGAEEVAAPPSPWKSEEELAAAARKEGLRARLRRWVSEVDWPEWFTLGLLALTLGELRVNNTWDYPTYLLVALAGLALARMLRSDGVAWREALPVAGRFVAVAVVSLLLFLPFDSRYGAAYTSVELWHGPRTQLGDYLMIHGLFLLILVSYVVSRAFGREARGALARSLRLSLGNPLRLGRYNSLSDLLVTPTAGYQLSWVLAIAVLFVAALGVITGWWIVALVLPLALISLSVALRRDLDLSERFAALLFAGGLLLTLAVEVIVLKGDVGRMNTVFKFYLQVWVLWGVAAAVGLSVLFRRWQRWRPRWRGLWQAALGCLIFGAALYPICATYGKINDRFDRSIGPTLDGTAYMKTAVYTDQQPLHLANDLAAIQWLEQNIQGSPVILEANTPIYRWGSRISIYTGLPTVIGWDWHEKQQRAVVSGEMIDWRLDDVRQMYDNPDVAQAAQLLQLYDVSYVYVGELERAYYSAEGLAKFDQHPELFEPVYRNGPVTIYRVRKENLGGLSTRPPSPS